MSAHWQVLGSGRYALGESPFWHPLEQMLYWVDITGRQILRANVYMGEVQCWAMPGEPGCIAPAASGGLVIALRDGVYRAPDWGGALQPLTTLPYDTATVRANDGKCDALGRFWVGTIDETKSQQAGALFSIDARQGSPVVQCQVPGALTANGLAWNPDNTRLYWADTPRHCVRAWDFALADNLLGVAQDFLQFASKPAGWQPPHGASSGRPADYGGRPDGAAVDVDGNYWVAMYEGSRVCQFAPNGTLLATLPVPLCCPTMPCFGGEDLRTLYLTSAAHGRSASELAAFPESGAVLFTRVETPGLPVNFFREAIF